jgi:hypothetical protein
MSLASQMFEYPSRPAVASPGPQIALVPRSRIVRDFVLLITVCVSVGLVVGLGMMAAVFALL